ncbi:MAG: hypothetical protein HC853_13720 [Anaerolineae bacterium]|nr:hypothetical protein [Anaerolineae bacterium]
MAYGFIQAMRGFVVLVLLVQSPFLSRSSAPCLQKYCIYLPVTNKPLVVTINQIQFGKFDKYGTEYAFGEVINNSNSPVYNVVVQVTFHYFTGSGYDLSFTNTTFLTATLPGQANAFRVDPLDGGKILSDAKVLSWSITPTVSFADLTVVASNVYTLPIDGPFGEPNFYTVVTSTLRNDTNSTLKDVQVYVWNVNTTLNSRQVISIVSPGATIVFSTSLFNSSLWSGVSPNDTIRIVAQGIVSP